MTDTMNQILRGTALAKAVQNEEGRVVTVAESDMDPITFSLRKARLMAGGMTADQAEAAVRKGQTTPT